MIVSVSRRTDVPAFYATWFFGRLKAGFVQTRNPMNPNQTRTVSLRPDDVDGFVFWTKNPGPMLDQLDVLEAYPYYFQMTLTPYGREIEPGLPDKKSVLLPALKTLAKKAGSKRTIWRYDPIFFSNRYTPEYHLRAFEAIANSLSGKIDTCVISFLDEYAGMKLRMGTIPPLSEAQILDFTGRLAGIGKNYGIRLFACCETNKLSEIGISPASCIDANRLTEISGRVIAPVRDKNQRPNCTCCASVDIGAYQTCPGGCLYCYANRNFKTSIARYQSHNCQRETLF